MKKILLLFLRLLLIVLQKKQDHANCAAIISTDYLKERLRRYQVPKFIYCVIFLLMIALPGYSQGTCNCTEMIYLNEPTTDGAVHKYSIASGGQLTEIGSPWFDNAVEGDSLFSPHGVAIDLNGFIYIGETEFGEIRKLDCDGEIVPASEFAIDDGGFNFASIGNQIFVNTRGGIMVTANNTCTQDSVSSVCFADGRNANDWGFHYSEITSKFYATGIAFGSNSDGHTLTDVWVFDIDDFGADDCVPPLISAGDGIVNVGDQELPYGNLRGITTDPDGNMYIVQQDRYGVVSGVERSGKLLKYSPEGEFIAETAWDTVDGDGGYFFAIGIIYSETSNTLFVSTGSSIEDCVAEFDLDLNYLDVAVPPSGSDDVAKGIGIIKECCPTPLTQTIDQTYCEAVIGEKLYLNEIFPCEGTVCGAPWMPAPNNIGVTYEECDQSITLNETTACATFTKQGSNQQCGAFNLTFNLEIFNITAPVLAGNSPTCANGNDPVAFTYTTPATSSSTISYRWQSSTTDCLSGFTDISGAPTDATPYDPPALSQETYYRVITEVSGTCSSGMCADTSNCVTISPELGCCILSDAGKTQEMCNDNGTSSDPSDDYISFSLNPTGSTLGSSYAVTVDNGGVVTLAAGGAATGVSYGSATAFRLQNGSADGAINYTITVTDVSGGACTLTTMVQQNSCSSTCTLNDAGETSEICNDNSTISDPADDYITFSLNPTGSNLGSSYTVTADNGGVITLVTGGSATGISYGSATAFRLQNGSADGTLYTVTVTDNGDANCISMTTLQQIGCAVAVYSLGNRVFSDDDISGDQNGTEVGIDGVELQLLNADGTVYDSDDATAGIQALTVITANDGYYRFDELPAGDYIVEIPATIFGSGGLLETYSSSNGASQEANPNNDGDLNDNGLDTTVGGAIRSGIITLGEAEPISEVEPNSYGAASTTGTAAMDTESNLTVDFGFYRQRDTPNPEDPEIKPCSDEPCHFISNNIYFGRGVTNDAPGAGSSISDTDTDDGLLWGDNVNAAPGNTLNLPIEIYNDTGNDSYFRMWIDWNGDGDFDDTNEQVVDELLLSVVYSGTFKVHQQVNIPNDAVSNQDLILRMRLSTDDTNTTDPCGNGDCAADGEVEDYSLRVTCPVNNCAVQGVSLMRN